MRRDSPNPALMKAPKSMLIDWLRTVFGLFLIRARARLPWMGDDRSSSAQQIL